MTGKVLIIQNKSFLSLKNNQLFIEQDGKTTFIPIEDIEAVVLDSLLSVITVNALSFLQESNVIILTCNNKHIPNGILLPLHQHSRQTEIALKQIAISKSFKKKCWKKIVKAKLFNQSECLKTFGKDNQILKSLIDKVESNDKTNMEAYAAKIYWKSLFSDNFTRSDDNLINAYLNYGYAIVRSIICQGLVSYGLLPCLGIFHKNSLNSFNLADDIIEPYRCFVDLKVKEITLATDLLELKREIKNKLIEVLFFECFIKNEIHTVLNAIKLTCCSLAASVKNEDVSYLILPTIL